jgi:hypothetical protein
MNKKLKKLHSDICKLINEAEKRRININSQLDSWNFITDINTNEIRLEGIEAAYELKEELEKIILDNI